MTSGQVMCAAGVGGLLVGLALGLRRKSRVAGRARCLLGADRPCGASWWWRLLGRARAGWLVPELPLLTAGLVAAQVTGSLVPLLVAAAAVLPLRRWRHRRRVTAEARQHSMAVIDLCAGLAHELRSGATPEQALHGLTVGPAFALRGLGTEHLARLAAGRYGADIPAAFRELSELPGGRGAAAIGACWQVTADSGTGLAGGLEQLADALRAERALAEEISAELAGTRTTIAVLALLPVLGLALGGALGAQPVQVLLHTPTGLLCLALGAALECAGLAWTARIVRAATDSPETGHRGRSSPDRPPVAAISAACGISRVRPGRAGVSW